MVCTRWRTRASSSAWVMWSTGRATFVRHDPPSWLGINALRAEAERLVAMLPAADHEVGLTRGVAVGGSATNVAKLTVGRSEAEIDAGSLERAFAALTRNGTGE